MDKKQLYESIMKNVAKEIKKAINECDACKIDYHMFKACFLDLCDDYYDPENPADNYDAGGFLSAIYDKTLVYADMVRWFKVHGIDYKNATFNNRDMEEAAYDVFN